MTLDHELQKLKDKSRWNYDHSLRVADVASGLAVQLGYEDTENFSILGKYHDVGKTRIPARILNKKGRMNPFERLIMDTHSDISADMLSGSGLAGIAEYARFHHETLDGRGPHKLTDVPIESQIVGAADYFDALVNARPYKSPMALNSALLQMASVSGVRYEPFVVDALLRMFWPVDYSPGSSVVPQTSTTYLHVVNH